MTKRDMSRYELTRCIFGLSKDQTIGALKLLLISAGLLSVGDQLDTVIVQDLDHFFDLIGEGCSLARIDYLPAAATVSSTLLLPRRKRALGFRRRRQ